MVTKQFFNGMKSMHITKYLQYQILYFLFVFYPVFLPAKSHFLYTPLILLHQFPIFYRSNISKQFRDLKGKVVLGQNIKWI